MVVQFVRTWDNYDCYKNYIQSTSKLCVKNIKSGTEDVIKQILHRNVHKEMKCLCSSVVVEIGV